MERANFLSPFPYMVMYSLQVSIGAQGGKLSKAKV